MNKFIKLKNVWIILVFIGVPSLCGLSGCASGPREQSNTASSRDSNAAISGLEDKMRQAQSESVDLLSPEHFLKSREHLRKAQGLRASNRDVDEINEEVQKGEAELKKAQETGQVSRAALSSVIEARTRAVDSGAPKYFARDFKSVDEKVLKHSNMIERGGSPKLSEDDQKEIIAKYRDLAMRGTREQAMGDSLRLLETAKNEGAKEWAPNTLQKVKSQVDHLDQVIKRNPDDQASIGSESKNLLEQSNLLLRVTRRSKQIQGRNPEAVALRIESQEMKLSKLGKEATEAQAQLEKQKASLQTEEKFNQVASTFSSNEAEVLRTADKKIIIRLKSLEFPAASSQIQSKNYTVLNKVSNVLKEFDNEKVVVEGHTDAKGSKKANLKISQKRAEAVKDYLVATGELPEEKVSAVGQGFSKPVATNKTKSGRAQNRRVDIILESTT